MSDGRWLSPEEAAEYLGVKEHHLPRLVRQGRVPAPSRQLGPRSPRYDRLALDSMMEGRQVTDRAALSTLADELRAQARV